MKIKVPCDREGRLADKIRWITLMASDDADAVALTEFHEALYRGDLASLAWIKGQTHFKEGER